MHVPRLNGLALLLLVAAVNPSHGQPKPEPVELKGHSGRVYSVAFSPDGKLLASGGDTIRMWNLATSQATRAGKGHEKDVSAVAFSPDGKQVATASRDGTVKLWNPFTGAETAALNVGRGPQELAYLRNGTLIAVADYSEEIQVWNVAQRKLQMTLKGHTATVEAVAANPAGTLLASAGHDKSIRLWDAATGNQARAIDCTTEFIRALAFTPDGKRLATGGSDGFLRLWDVAAGKELSAIATEEDGCRAIAFGPDGKLMVSSHSSGGVRLWDIDAGREVASLAKPDREHQYAFGVAFSPDGKRIALACPDGVVRLWTPLLTGANPPVVAPPGIPPATAPVAAPPAVSSVPATQPSAGPPAKVPANGVSPGHKAAIGKWKISRNGVRVTLEPDGSIKTGYGAMRKASWSIGPDGLISIKGPGGEVIYTFRIDATGKSGTGTWRDGSGSTPVKVDDD